MPHCIIEYSNDLTSKLNIQDLVMNVFTGAVNSELFSSSHIKTRATAYSDYLVGDTASSYIHVTIKLLSGRTPEQRKMLSDSVTLELKKMVLPPISISIEIVDMEKESYSKLDT